jgi:hypothetical protein
MVKVYLNPHACLINWPRGSSINGLQRRLWVITSISTPVLQLKSFGFVYNMWLPRQKRLVHSIQLYMLYNWKAIISSEQNEIYLMITSLTSKKICGICDYTMITSLTGKSTSWILVKQRLHYDYLQLSVTNMWHFSLLSYW